MARVDYYNIETKIQSALTGAAALAGVTVEIESELLFSMERTPWIGVYFDRRSPADQSLSAGQRTKYRLYFSVWCWEFNLDPVAAIQRRDDLVGKTEVALMGDRTLDGTVRFSWLEGGQMPSGRLPEQTGFVSGGEIILVAEAEATT